MGAGLLLTEQTLALPLRAELVEVIALLTILILAHSSKTELE